MQLKKLVWHIFPPNLIVTLGSLIAILWYSSLALDSFYNNWIATDLEERAYLIEDQVSDLLALNQREKLNAFCRRIGRKASTRITVVDPSGTVVADSDENPDKMGNHSTRPEIKNAIGGLTGTELRFSSTLGVKMLYVAIPLVNKSPDISDKKFHVLRMSMPASAIDLALQSLRINVAVSGSIVALLAMLAAILVSRKISKPLEIMRNGAEQFAQENFDTPLPISSNYSLEVGALATAMNSMAQKLQERISTIILQRNELQTILASMEEAILVIDNNKQVTKANISALKLLGITESKAIGSTTQEIIRDIRIETIVDKILAAQKTIKDEITLNKGEEKIFLQFSGVRLYDRNGESFGAVLVFNNVTNIRRLENIRKEFVANVSHELLTPLTSIKGYTETIIDIGQDDKEQVEKFLQIILRQSNRLQAILTDLLELSLIEKEIETKEISFVSINVKDILEESIHVCGLKASEKDINIELDCLNDLMAPINTHLMEQAVVNLLVNAIKYSEPSSRIEIKAERHKKGNEEEMIAIRVRDYGVGIGKEHLPRLFERFYRSDKARSRKLGGTGLGLSIVKHIVQSHHGSVSVDSEVGVGTVFTILIPTTRIKPH